ncbi:uncharacterized protein LOC103713101 [Phoenix dactylifera]|uniref:Uncharacterized protein LOC103713101 n=1 Tax=Phoenix dactylifera TaxID=42345 RepID=A0A8B7CFD6_PHODC|nr:uncharacterized protein LOC103713101 [Phoenix dactylifera]
MGCSFSCRSSQPFHGVRVIHINGYVEDFAGPVTAGQVTGRPPKHVLFSAAHLLSPGSRPLQPDDVLEAGRIYFLLPHSVFQSDSSPVDLASLMTRLTAIARRGGPAPAGGPPPTGGLGNLGPGIDGPWRSRARTWKPELDPIEERSLGRSMGRDSYSSSSPDRKREVVAGWEYPIRFVQ